MSELIIGRAILDCKLLEDALECNLKHSTYDLTVGEIIPTGQTSLQPVDIDRNKVFFLEPRQSVLVLSKEEFRLPGTVTGLATLRTTLTKNGLLALNVGIIDPFFNGPISTTLINFSDQPVPIKIGMPFFRVLFFFHKDTEGTHRGPEDKERKEYLEELNAMAKTKFPKSFLNIPELDNAYYSGIARKMLLGVIKKNKIVSFFFAVFSITVVYYLFAETGYWSFLKSILDQLDELPFL
jgi:deoxycytidine triphosphate deaminase